MASVRKEPSGKYSVLVYVHKKRRSVRLETFNKDQATVAAKHIQEIATQKNKGEVAGDNAMRWLASEPPVVRDRLERAGVITVTLERKQELEAAKRQKVEEKAAKQHRTLKQLTDRFLKSNDNNKESTKTTYNNIVRNLHIYFGPSKPIADVTPQDAAEFRSWLKRKGNVQGLKPCDRATKSQCDKKGKPMAENTVRRRTGLARQVFKVGVRAKWIKDNPFEGLPGTWKRNAVRDVYIPPETIVDCINAANDWEWRTIFALSGFAGLRGASEILTLRWDAIDFGKGAIGEMVVRSPKTEHHEGQESRIVPIFPDLEPYLREAEQMAEQIANDEQRAVEFVIDSYRGDWDGRNLNQHAKRIIKRAGHGVIPKIFPNLRASGETDLIGSHEFDINDIAAWWGHSVEVALKHYSRRRDDHAQAALSRLAAKATHEDNSKPARFSRTVGDRIGAQEAETRTVENEKARELRDSRASRWAMRDCNKQTKAKAKLGTDEARTENPHGSVTADQLAEIIGKLSKPDRQRLVDELTKRKEIR